MPTLAKRVLIVVGTLETRLEQLLTMARILYVQYTNPAGYPPLEHSSRILADSDWQVLFLGTGAAGADKLRFPAHPNIRVRQMGFCIAGWKQKLHYFAYVLWAIAWVIRWRPHWIYASDILSCPLACLLSYLPGLRVIYHEHDSPNSEGCHSRFFRWCLASRQRLGRRAMFCVLPNNVRADLFAKQVKQSAVRCVWNCPTRDEVALPRLPVNGA